jgi:hypothetical protein
MKSIHRLLSFTVLLYLCHSYSSGMHSYIQDKAEAKELP